MDTPFTRCGGYLDTTLTLEHCAEYGGWLCEHVETIAETDGDGVYDQKDDRVWGAVSMTPTALETLIGGIGSSLFDLGLGR